jgi:hypothetical protein
MLEKEPPVNSKIAEINLKKDLKPMYDVTTGPVQMTDVENLEERKHKNKPSSLVFGTNCAIVEIESIPLGVFLRLEHNDFQLSSFLLGSRNNCYPYYNPYDYPYAKKIFDGDTLYEVKDENKDVLFELEFGYKKRLSDWSSLSPLISYHYRNFYFLNIYEDKQNTRRVVDIDLTNHSNIYSLFEDGRDSHLDIGVRLELCNTLFYTFNYGFFTNAPINQRIGYFAKYNNFFSSLEFSATSKSIYKNTTAIYYTRIGIGYFFYTNDKKKDENNWKEYAIVYCPAICNGLFFMMWLMSL